MGIKASGGTRMLIKHGKKNKMVLTVLFIMLLTALFLSACSNQNSSNTDKKTETTKEEKMPLQVNKENIRTIYLAGGCFWGVEGYFARVKGVVETETGYANGKADETDYHSLSSTDHAETVKIDYDFSVISLDEILLHYFRVIDPKSINRQGNDIGRQYRTGVYYIDEKDLKTIDRVFDYEKGIHGEIAVEKEALKNFVKAEEYHQDYLKKNPNGYCHISLAMADEPLFKEGYNNPENEEDIKKKLDEESYNILRKNGTEAPHSSALNEEYRRGIYVDKITGEPLFASQDKFDSGCGWPSFSKPILTDRIEYKGDTSHGMNRTEVRSSGGDNHLGHVFTDGPKEKGGLRYCINGLALEFIPYEEMDERGYGDYKTLTE